MSDQPRRFAPIRKQTLWHIAMDTAIGEHAFHRTPLCSRVQGAVHVRTTPTSEWGDERSGAWSIDGITCQSCVRRYRKRMEPKS